MSCGLTAQKLITLNSKHTLAKVAQLVERVSEKHEVTGSSPVLGTSISERHTRSLLFCQMLEQCQNYDNHLKNG